MCFVKQGSLWVSKCPLRPTVDQNVALAATDNLLPIVIKSYFKRPVRDDHV